MQLDEFSYEMKDKMKRINIDITNKQVEKFFSYMNLLIEWNKKINLTTIIEPKEIIIKHFVDCGTILKYLKENMEVTILSFKGKVFAVEPPIFVELEVTYTEPGFAGNTTTTSGKPAKLETGLELQVPMFVNIGDVLRIDTRTCEYMERV